MFSYYLEMITAAGLVGFITSSGGPAVAPHGGATAIFGTNPVALGFPTVSDPIIWDIGTSDALLADLSLAIKLGQPIREGIAYDADARPTTDPAAALDGGAITVWGGHRGSGLALSAQLLGMMVGSQTAPPWLTDMGLFIAVFDPRVFTRDFPARAASYAMDVRAVSPVHDGGAVRVPFDRSRSEREERRAAGTIDVADEILARLRAFAAAEA
jgi:LDH2 family malate/lactate/ureidoglycolate dehydrogenase